jgi:hypothetical protein
LCVGDSTILMVRSAAARRKRSVLCRQGGCGASRTMRPQTGPPSPSRRALAMEYVLETILFTRPPQAEGGISTALPSRFKSTGTCSRAHPDRRESGCALDSYVGACPFRKTGIHFSGTCADCLRNCLRLLLVNPAADAEASAGLFCSSPRTLDRSEAGAGVPRSSPPDSDRRPCRDRPGRRGRWRRSREPVLPR